MIDKKEFLLDSIIKAYIEHLEPIGSGQLKTMYDIAYSPATIRGYFKKLGDEGYLAQEHASSGRTPTTEALKEYWTNRLDIKLEHINYNRLHLLTKQIGLTVFLKEQQLTSKPIYADSAEPRLISELRKMGHNIFGSIKGRDSINAGIDLLKRYKIHILAASSNAISEFRNYKWKEDKSGRLINIPDLVPPCSTTILLLFFTRCLYTILVCIFCFVNYLDLKVIRHSISTCYFLSFNVTSFLSFCL